MAVECSETVVGGEHVGVQDTVGQGYSANALVDSEVLQGVRPMAVENYRE